MSNLSLSSTHLNVFSLSMFTYLLYLYITNGHTCVKYFYRFKFIFICSFLLDLFQIYHISFLIWSPRSNNYSITVLIRIVYNVQSNTQYLYLYVYLLYPSSISILLTIVLASGSRYFFVTLWNPRSFFKYFC